MKTPEPSQLTVFVTGASAGFGSAIANRFASSGHRVIAAARRIERLYPLRKRFGDHLIVAARVDVRNLSSINEAISSLPVSFAEIDVLVNNAGLALGLEPAQKAKIGDWEIMVDTNIKGLMYCTQALLPKMVRRNRGHIINLGSTAGEVPYPGGNVYGATKAFVHQFTLNLKADLLGTAIRVTSIEPGLCGGTEFSNVRFADDAKADALYAGTEPLTADDIAEAVFWTASLPSHVNINYMQMMPVCQSFGPLAVHRKET
ncbi:MAG: SDR family NAD(P)-dependent oxidoreductase [Verrucomicrobia bacterium]|nr:SDR family NAD(P)-dependent oxidoreductase [Verrucomicrobiota bacterium]